MNPRDYVDSGFFVGPAKNTRGGKLRLAEYADGSLAFLLFSSRGLEAKCTVFVEGEPLPRGEVWIKDWSENEGIASALSEASVIELTGRKIQCGFVEALHAKVNESIMELVP